MVYLEGHIRVQPADRYRLGFRICYQNLLRHVVLDLDLVELLEGLPSVHIVVFVVIPPSSSSSFNFRWWYCRWLSSGNGNSSSCSSSFSPTTSVIVCNDRHHFTSRLLLPPDFLRFVGAPGQINDDATPPDDG